MKILNFGSLNIDYVYSLDHIVSPGETATSHKFEIFPGGKGLNQSIAASRAGAKIYHAGCIGCDGSILTEVLLKNGVDISYINKEQERNGHAIIRVEASGQNSIFVFSGANSMVSENFVDTVLENFEKGDIILLQNEIRNVDYIVEKAYQKEMCTIFNPSPFNQKIKNIDFNKLSYIIVNEVEAKEITGTDIPEDSLLFMKNKYPNLKVILTIGDKGCFYADSENKIYQSAFDVRVVDTTAAGDTFAGYFTAELAKGTSYAAILKIASAASALAVSENGAEPSIPDREKVFDAIEGLKEKTPNRQTELIRLQIEAYIQQNIKNANLNELSELIGYSVVHTENLVKKITGKSFSKLIQERRCVIAAEKMRETDLSVDEIIKEVGYENAGFFRKIFKEKYGVNPMEYRKKYD